MKKLDGFLAKYFLHTVERRLSRIRLRFTQTPGVEVAPQTSRFEGRGSTETAVALAGLFVQSEPLCAAVHHDGLT